MEIISRLFGRETGSASNLESFTGKVVRHIFTGDFKLSTLLRGWEYYCLFLESRSQVLIFGEGKVEHNFAGNQGTSLYLYQYDKDDIYHDKGIGARVIEFTEGSKIKIVIRDLEDLTDTMGSDFLDRENAYAAFAGPTRYNELPNNGFYDRALGGVLRPFMDTNPPGQRRGAIATDNRGNFVILDEPARTQARNSGFSDFQIVSGTSFYLQSSDSSQDIELLTEPDRSVVTYIIKFQDKNGNERFAHVTFAVLLNRREVKNLLDIHAARNSWKEYIAAELEHLGGGCVVKTKTGAAQSYNTNTRGDSYNINTQRLDNYFVYQE